MRAQICTGNTIGDALFPAAEIITEMLPMVMLTGYNSDDELTVAVAAHGRTSDGPTVASFHMLATEFDEWVDYLVAEREKFPRRRKR